MNTIASDVPVCGLGTGEAEALVIFDQVTKRFGSTEALGSVSIAGHAGTVHAITGENGAGKSTLMNLLAGVHHPEEGEVRLSGRRVILRTPSEARSLGISTIFQELTLLPNLTVAENMFLGREPRRYGLVDRATMRRVARSALDRLGSTIPEDAHCGDLSVGEQQLVEIAKGISADAQIFILDEPTAALNAPEVEKLAKLIQAMKSAGKLIFYISHRLDEIFRLCDTVSVLKDGRHVATRSVGELDRDQLVSLMVGRTLGQLYPPRSAIRPAKPALSITGLRTVAQPPVISLSLARGEILGLAGLEGQGQRGIIRAIAGIDAPLAGEVVKHAAAGGEGHAVRPTIVSVTAAGIGFAPEDRKAEGLYLPLSVAENMALGTMREQSLWSRARSRVTQIRALLDRMRVQAASGPGQAVGFLSGGNQQKVMLGRWFASGVDVLLIEEPTRGVDVGAKAEIYALLREFANAGGAVLITSSELTEVLGLCDRILVVRGGALVAEFEGASAQEEEIMRAALSGVAPNPARGVAA